MKIGIVVSEYNYDITMNMLQRAEEEAKFLGAEVARVFKVPGTFDIPLGVQTLLNQKEIDGVVTLGAVIKGETDHDEVIMNNAARKIADLSLEFSKPVALILSIGFEPGIPSSMTMSQLFFTISILQATGRG